VVDVTELHRSPIFQLAHDIVERDAQRDPLFATGVGISGSDHLLPDYSPEGSRATVTALRDELDRVQQLTPRDDIDRVAQEILRERLSSRLELAESGESARIFSVLWSPLTEIRQGFELMSVTSAQDVANVGQRLSAVAAALDGWRTTIQDLVDRDQLPPRRHVVGVGEQAATFGEGGFTSILDRIHLETGLDVAGQLPSAQAAEAACRELAEWLVRDIAPCAGVHDACGAERYHKWARSYTGATLDLGELYQWGYADLQRINKRMWEIAGEIAPAAQSLMEVADFLDNDESRLIVGTDALLERLVGFTQQAINDLDGVHFDIDPRIRTCDARLAPDGSGAAAYYIGPSEDLSRPGTTWFPTMGKTSFPWWRSVSTWYHEGVPGHHLQSATAIIERDRQSRFQRLEGWMSGYGEGWALYAERLMNELGYFSDPGDEMGHLSDQALRAARIVVDIGMHLELPAPDSIGVLGELGECGGRVWDADMAVALLREWAIVDEVMARSEVDRYLGNPGQAISYKVGERVWVRARQEAHERYGDSFSLKRFHAYALALGPMGLDAFEEEMKRWDGN